MGVAERPFAENLTALPRGGEGTQPFMFSIASGRFLNVSDPSQGNVFDGGCSKTMG